MKKISVVLILLVSAVAIFAQSPIAKGQAQINAGIGLSSWGLPLYGGVDYGIHEKISVGGEISFRSYSTGGYKHSIIGISANGNYHFGELLEVPSEWDLYGGLNLGFYIWNSPSEYSGSQSSSLGLGAQVGARYYFTEKFAANLEFGGGNAFSGGKLGISIKL